MASQPLHERISAEFRGKIESGEWGEGTIIPSEVELAQSYGVSRPTIRHALEPLVAEGMLDRRRKRGTMVRRAKLGQSLVADPFASEALRVPAGAVVRVELLSLRRVPAEGLVAGRLGVAAGSLALRVVRRRLVDGIPNALAETFVPDSLAGGFGRVDPSSMPLAQTLADAGHPVLDVRARIEVTAARTKFASQLGVEEGVPAFQLQLTAYGVDSVPLVYTVAVLRADLVAFDVAAVA